MLRRRGRRNTGAGKRARLCALHLLDAVHGRVRVREVQEPAWEVRTWGLVGAGEPRAGEHLLVRARVDPVLRDRARIRLNQDLWRDGRDWGSSFGACAGWEAEQVWGVPRHGGGRADRGEGADGSGGL